MCSWQAVVMRLRITQGAEGFARIGKTTGLSGDCLFLWRLREVAAMPITSVMDNRLSKKSCLP